MKNIAKTQLQSHFSQSVHADINRSTFMRNSTRKTSFNCGKLVPIYVDEVLPGDTFEMDMAFVSRLATPIFPTMDVLYLDFYAFFVPNRIVWDGWEELQGENKTGAWTPQTPPALVPVIDGSMYGGVVQRKKLGDYMGLPVGMNCGNFPVSALPFRGYVEIWNEWFRDQNHQAPYVYSKGNTIEVPGGTTTLLNRDLHHVNKKHDYFTSCLPAPQKGESALIPVELNELIPVITGANYTPLGQHQSTMEFRTKDGGYMHHGMSLTTSPTQGGAFGALHASTTQAIGAAYQNLVPANLWADASGIQFSASTIHDLRTAVQIQKLYERDARGGTRYVEMLKAHFGVTAEDYRLQRPEFLGSMQSIVGMKQVASTVPTVTSGRPQGELAAYSQTVGKGRLFRKSFTEHGFVFIFAVARHPKTYQQGLERFWSRRERLDFYMPVLAHISEQPVYNKEIYALTDQTRGNEIFGYNEAWADYRYKPNTVTGDMRSGVNSFDVWHYADWYDAPPVLSDAWLRDNSQENVDRTLAISSAEGDQIIMDIVFQCKATRPMPVNSVPGFMDHF